MLRGRRCWRTCFYGRIAAIEDVVDTVWGDLSASAQSVIDKQGIAYTDRDGDLVTSIVHGKRLRIYVFTIKNVVFVH